MLLPQEVFWHCSTLWVCTLVGSLHTLHLEVTVFLIWY